MDLKKISAAAMCAAIIATAAIPLAACGRSNGKPLGKGELNIADYAVSYEDSLLALTTSNSHAAVEMKKLATGLGWIAPLDSSSKFYCGMVNGSNGSVSYTVYNVLTGKTVVANAVSEPKVYNTDYIRMRSPGSTDVYTFYGEDGTFLASGESDTLEMRIFSCYIDGKSAAVLQVSTDDLGADYFKISYDDERNKSYTAVSASSIKYTLPSDTAGADRFGTERPVYSSLSQKPVEGEITNYTYTVSGGEAVFYNSGIESGRVSLENVDIGAIAFVGNYFYYQTKVVLPENGSANLIEVEDGSYVYYDCTLHRYDIIHDEDVKLDYNVSIDGIQPVYNYTTKAYDAAILVCREKADKVVQNTSKIYAVTAKLEIAYDISDFDTSFIELIKVDDDRFIVNGSNGYTVVDSSLKRKCVMRNAAYYPNEKLFCYSTGGRYGFTDLDGKVVIEPIYVPYSNGSLVFYGGAARVRNYPTSQSEILFSDGSTRPAPASSTSGSEGRTDVRYYDGWYSVTKSASSDGSASVEFFRFDGASLGSFAILGTVSVNGSAVFFRTSGTQGGSAYSLYFIK